MIAEISTLKRVCTDFTKVENYIKAINDDKHMWHLHHKLGLNHSIQELKDNNLYYHRPPEELEFLPSVVKGEDMYQGIACHSKTHKDAKTMIEASFEYQSFINELSRKQCDENKIIRNKLQFESWVEAYLVSERIKTRLDNEGLELQTGLDKDFIEELIG